MFIRDKLELLQCLEAYSPAPTEYFRRGAERFTASINMVPDGTGRVLELGCDSHFTLAMSLFTKYTMLPQNSPSPIAAPEDVGDPVVTFTGKNVASVRFERLLFDVERDRYPFSNGSLDGVMCCELIEHLFQDPAWMLHEANRILKLGAWLLLTTPNLTSYHSVRRAAQGINPLEHSLYFHGERYPGLPIQHAREYTFWEIIELLRACGFRIECMRTFTFSVSERLGLWEYLVLVPALTLYNVLKFRHPKHLLLRYRRPHTLVLARKDGCPTDRYPAQVYFQ